MKHIKLFEQFVSDEIINEGGIGYAMVDYLREIAKNKKMRNWTAENFPNFQFEKYITILAQLEYNKSAIELLESVPADKLDELSEGMYENLDKAKKEVVSLEKKLSAVGPVPSELQNFFSLYASVASLISKSYLINIVLYRRKDRFPEFESLSKSINVNENPMKLQVKSEIEKLFSSKTPSEKVSDSSSDEEIMKAYNEVLLRRAERGGQIDRLIGHIEVPLQMKLGVNAGDSPYRYGLLKVFQIEKWSPLAGKISIGDTIMSINGISLGNDRGGSLIKATASIQEGDTIKIVMKDSNGDGYTVSVKYDGNVNWFSSGSFRMNKDEIVRFTRLSRY